MSNCLRLGQRVMVDPYWPNGYAEDTHWSAHVRRFAKFHGSELVLVEAEDRSDDPMVENEMWFPFGALKAVA